MLCFIRKVKIPLVAIWLPGRHPPTKRATIQSEVARISLYDLDLDALEAQLAAWGEPRAQARALAREIWRYLYREYSITPHDITPLPSSLQSQLHEEVSIPHPTLLRETLSPEGSTRKVLLGLEDGAQIEAVPHGLCAPTRERGDRRPGDPLSAVALRAGSGCVQRRLYGHGRTSAEPRRDVGGHSASDRPTISTAGVAPGIVRLAEIHHHWPTKLAISLHAATDDLRDTLMPIATGALRVGHDR